MSLKKMSDKSAANLYVVFRVLLGLMFLFHGLGKFLPGFWGPGSISAFAGMFGSMGFLAYLVGIGEILVGLGVMTGFMTRLAALGGAVIMAGALLLVHIGLMMGKFNLNLLTNGGELALLYLIAFLVVFGHGAHKFSIDHDVLKKEYCYD